MNILILIILLKFNLLFTIGILILNNIKTVSLKFEDIEKIFLSKHLGKYFSILTPIFQSLFIIV